MATVMLATVMSTPRYRDEDENLGYSDKSNKSMDLWNPQNLSIYPRIYKKIHGFKPQTCEDFMMKQMKRTEN